MQMRESLRIALSSAAVLGAWIALALLNVAGLISFGGWVGPADGFLVWSLGAAALWHVSRARLELLPLHRTHTGRIILGVWWVSIGLAAAGIDERAWAPWPRAVAWTYLAMPLFPVIALAGAMICRATRANAAA
jgi:hypothetical protein